MMRSRTRVRRYVRAGDSVKVARSSMPVATRPEGHRHLRLGKPQDRQGLPGSLPGVQCFVRLFRGAWPVPGEPRERHTIPSQTMAAA